MFRPLQARELSDEVGRDWDLLDRAKAEVSRTPDIPPIEKVRELLACIPGSLSRDVIAERGDY